MKKILSPLMKLIVLLALLLPFSPYPLYFFHAQSTVDFIFALTFSLIMAEKVYAMIFRMRQSNLLSVDRDWTAVAVGLAYTATMYAVIIDFFYRGQGIELWLISLLGLSLYIGALILRYWSFSHLGRQWAVQLDQTTTGMEERKLVRTGPYGWIRHPLYLGACLECVAIPLMFNSFWALALGLATFVPLEIKRARFEEQFLETTFGPEYEQYADAVHAWIPGLRGSPGSARKS